MRRPEFDDLRTAAYCCGHVFRRERAVLLVDRADGDWQFLCGNVDHHDPLEPYHVSVGALVDADLTLHQIADIESQWEAERTEVGAAWLKTQGAR